MYYINNTPTNDNYGIPQTTDYANAIILPEELLQTYLENKGFVKLKVSDGTIVEIEKNVEAYDAYMEANPEMVVPASELRRIAYETEPIVEWEGNMITVDQAEDLFGKYFAEGREDVYETLRRVIAEAKTTIREQYPD